MRWTNLFYVSAIAVLATSFAVAEPKGSATQIQSKAVPLAAKDCQTPEKNVSEQALKVWTEVPLSQIIHGTSAFNNFRDLDPEEFGQALSADESRLSSTPEGATKLAEKYKQTKLFRIDHAIALMDNEPMVRPGFAIEGDKSNYISSLYRVLVDGKKPTERFQAGANITVVFFARRMQPVVQLDRVARKEDVIRIHYSLLSHPQLTLTHYLAFIPLGVLPPAEYRVEMIRSENEKQQRDDMRPVAAGLEDHIVCKPFTFIVAEKP